MTTYNNLYSRALMRSGQRINYTLFMSLPQEVRGLIYGYVLASPCPIQPHLCASDSHSKPSFHDANNTDHASVFQLTALTRASKKLRKEALPVFYAANVFAAGDDTVTYLEYLQGMGRLEWVQNVELAIEAGCVERAAWVLRCVEQVDVEGAQHEKEGRRALLLGEGEKPGETRVWRGGASTTGSTTSTTTTAHRYTGSGAGKAPAPYLIRTAPSTPLITQDLTLHPHYHVSGFQPLALALLLRLLSTPSPTSSTSPSTLHSPTRHIVLPLPNPHIFTQDAKLRWFPALVHGLGMSLCFVARRGSARMEGEGRFVVVRWERRFQGLGEEHVTSRVGEGEAAVDEVGDARGEVTGGGAQGQGVLDRAREMIPGLEELRRSDKTCFSRRGCREEKVMWFDLETFGGAHV